MPTAATRSACRTPITKAYRHNARHSRAPIPSPSSRLRPSARPRGFRRGRHQSVLSADARNDAPLPWRDRHDRVFLDGELIEDTFDWYAQQSNGDVWYLGEASKEIKDPAAHVNEEYKQEYYRGVAEDVATVIGVDENVDVPHGSFTGCIKTEDRNPLEQGAVEHKLYCSGIGLTLEGPADGSERFELTEVTAP